MKDLIWFPAFLLVLFVVTYFADSSKIPSELWQALGTLIKITGICVIAAWAVDLFLPDKGKSKN